MSNFIDILEVEFTLSANPEYAIAQKAYLKNQFEFFGIMASSFVKI